MAKDPIVGDVDLQYQPKPVTSREAAQVPFTAGSDLNKDAWVVIFAGGRGTRLAEETQGLIPKPMVDVGGYPMLWHIMKIYANQGFGRFLIAAGYLQEKIVEWVEGNFVQMGAGVREIIVEDTGMDTQTGGRLLRLRDFLGDKTFMLTYGDGFADINFAMLVDHHRALKQPGQRKAVLTLSAVHPPARFGNLALERGRAVSFGEKTQLPNDWINGGFYIVEPTIFNLITGDDVRLEYDLLPALAFQQRLGAYQHPGFFQMVDTWRDLQLVKQMYDAKQAPWARWE